MTPKPPKGGSFMGDFAFCIVSSPKGDILIARRA
jgi:hypothetical protein